MIFKKYLTLITLILFLFTNKLLICQNHFQSGNTVVVFDTTLYFNLNENFGPFTVYFTIIDSTEVTIYDTKIFDNKNKFIQSINDTINFMGIKGRMAVDRFHDEPSNPNFNNDISFVDINFDGYKDIKIKQFIDMQGHSAFRYFLYNPNSNNFIYDKDFSELCCNLSLNSKLKEIAISEYRWQEEKYTTVFYKVIDNKPVHVRTKIELVFTEDNKQKFRTIIKKFIDGKMKIIKDTTIWKGM